MYKSVYESMLDVWVAHGGAKASTDGPAWTWRSNPSPGELITLLSHPPAFDVDCT